MRTRHLAHRRVRIVQISREPDAVRRIARHLDIIPYQLPTAQHTRNRTAERAVRQVPHDRDVGTKLALDPLVHVIGMHAVPLRHTPVPREETALGAASMCVRASRTSTLLTACAIAANHPRACRGSKRRPASSCPL